MAHMDGKKAAPPDAAAALRRAVEARIKPLVWNTFPNGGAQASTIFGKYSVHQRFYTGPDAYRLSGIAFGYANTLEAAKAAAQADYTRRILTALGWEDGE